MATLLGGRNRRIEETKGGRRGVALSLVLVKDANADPTRDVESMKQRREARETRVLAQLAQRIASKTKRSFHAKPSGPAPQGKLLAVAGLAANSDPLCLGRQ